MDQLFQEMMNTQALVGELRALPQTVQDMLPQLMDAHGGQFIQTDDISEIHWAEIDGPPFSMN